MSPAPPPALVPPAYLRSGEVAALLGVDPRTVNRWAKQGRLPHIRTPGGEHRYPADEVRRLAASQAQPATAATDEAPR